LATEKLKKKDRLKKTQTPKNGGKQKLINSDFKNHIQEKS